MVNVFLNYRGSDGALVAYFLYRELTTAFDGEVFYASRSISLGGFFDEDILKALRDCDVMVVIIGPHWLTVADTHGARRLDDKMDWVRREIAAALCRGIRLIPLLVEGASMPPADQLPVDIRDLTRCHYLRLRHRHGELDLVSLVDQLRDMDPDRATAPGTASRMAALTEREQHVRNDVNGGVSGTAVQANIIQGGVHLHTTSLAGVVPQQLPAAPHAFAGRTEELASLSAVLDRTTGSDRPVVISAVGGVGGVGKTWLALRWAHQHLDLFPDGQLYVDLRGFDPSDEPIRPASAILGFLHALGVDQPPVSAGSVALVGLYRSLLADKRMLIVLDNAVDTAQVALLIPGGRSCAVIVTSRRHLTGLVSAHGAVPLDLDTLTEREARDLLSKQIGEDRLAAEPAAVNTLLDYCAGLPLALSIVAARAAFSPRFPLGILADELRDVDTRLNALDAGEAGTNLRTVLSWSCRALTTETATIFGLLALAPGPDISRAAAIALTDLPEPQVAATLHELQDAHLLQQPTPGRYRMHDLVRLYAAELVPADNPALREAPLRRVLSFYLHTALNGDRLLDPNRQPLDDPLPAPGCLPVIFSNKAEALDWFDLEHSCLLAAQHIAVDRAWSEMAWQLAWVLNTFHWSRGHLDDRLTVWKAALSRIDDHNSPQSQLAHRLLGATHARLGHGADALENLQQALATADRANDQLNKAHAYRSLARAWEQQNDHHQALENAVLAYDLYNSLDASAWANDARDLIGLYHAKLGDYQAARVHCLAALQWYRDHDDRYGHAATLETLGYIEHHTGNHAQAIHMYHIALSIHTNLGNTSNEADILRCLGHSYTALGQRTHAREAWTRARTLYQLQHRLAEVTRIEQYLMTLDHE